jgi:hypothetical protein
MALIFRTEIPTGMEQIPQQQVVYEQNPDQQQGIHNDLAISDSDEEQNNLQMDIYKEEQETDNYGELFF